MKLLWIFLFLTLAYASDFFHHLNQLKLQDIRKIHRTFKNTASTKQFLTLDDRILELHDSNNKPRSKRDVSQTPIPPKIDEQFASLVKSEWTSVNPFQTGKAIQDILRPDFGTNFQYLGPLNPSVNAWTLTLQLNMPQVILNTNQIKSICDSNHLNVSDCVNLAYHECQLRDENGMPTSAFWQRRNEYVEILRHQVRAISSKCRQYYNSTSCDTNEITCILQPGVCMQRFLNVYEKSCDKMITMMCNNLFLDLQPVLDSICENFKPFRQTLNNLATSRIDIIKRKLKELNKLWPDVSQEVLDNTSYILHHGVTDSDSIGQDRHKRGAALGILGAIAGGSLIGSIVNFFQMRSLKRAVQGLQTYAQDTRKQMFTLAKKLETFQHATLSLFQETNVQLSEHKQQIIDLQRILQETVITSHVSDKFLLSLLSKVIYELHFGYFRILDEYLLAINKMMEAMPLLYDNKIPITLLSPKELKIILKHVSNKVAMEYPEYILAFDHPSAYYHGAFCSHFMVSDKYFLQLKFFIKPKFSTAMHLYKKSVIPIAWNTSSSENDKYTILRDKHNYIGVSKDFYMLFTDIQFQDCFLVSNTYICPESLLIEVISKHHTCLSTLIYGLSTKLVTKHCKFDLVFNQSPGPTVLSHSKYMLISNIDKPVSFNCLNNDMLKYVSLDEYVIIDKASVCLCSIQSPTVFIGRQLSLCPDNMDQFMNLSYSANFAVLNLLQNELTHFSTSIFNQAHMNFVNGFLPELTVYKYDHANVLDSTPSVLDLHKLSQASQDYDTFFHSLSDKGFFNDKFENWHQSPSKIPIIVIAVVSVLGLLALLVTIFLCCRHNMMASSLAALLLPKPVNAATNEDIMNFLIQHFDYSSFVVRILQHVAIHVLFVITIFCIYHFLKYLFRNCKLLRVIIPIKPFDDQFPFQSAPIDAYINISNGIEDIIVYLGTLKTPLNNISVRDIYSVQVTNISHHCGYTRISVDWNSCIIALKLQKCTIHFSQTYDYFMAKDYENKIFPRSNKMPIISSG